VEPPCPLIGSHLEAIVGEHEKSADQQRQLEALRLSFETLQFNMGKKTWTREELYHRPSNRKWSAGFKVDGKSD
jgi:hypothetical protein